MPRSALLAVDRAVTVIAMLLLVGAAIVSPIAAGISGMRSTGCVGRCDLALVGAGSGVIVVGVVGVAVLTVIGLVVAFPRLRFVAWIPVCGLGATVLLAAVGEALIGAGVGG